MAVKGTETKKNESLSAKARNGGDRIEEVVDEDFEADHAQPRSAASVTRLTGASTSRSSRERTYFKAYTEWLEENNIDDTRTDSRVIPVTGELAATLDTNGMCIVVTNIENDVFWHGMIFEGREQTVQSHNIRGRRDDDDRRSRRDESDNRVKEYRYLSDRLSNKSVDKFGEWVATQVDCDGEILFSDFTIVPYEAKLDDFLVVETYLRNAEESNIVASGQDRIFNAKSLNGGYLEGTLTFNDSDREDVCPITNLPLRSDFQTTVIRKMENNRNSRNRDDYIGSEDYSEETNVVGVEGFVNLRVVGTESRSRRRRDDVDLAFCQPEVIATDVNTLTAFDRGIVGRYFVGIASMVALQDGDSWKRPFMPRVVEKGNKLSNIVNMSLVDANDWPEDINEADESNDSAEDLLDLITPEDTGVEYSVLVRENGLGYACGKLLIDLTLGDKDDAARYAMEDIIVELDETTDGLFSEMVDVQVPSDIVVGSVRMPWGYFQDHRMRPIEDVDTIYLANNMSALRSETLDDWVESTAPADRAVNYNEGMSFIINAYNEATGNFVNKGVATKVTLNPEFLTDLYEVFAAKDSGLELDMNTSGRRGYTHGRKRSSRRETFGLSGNPTRRGGSRSYSGASRGNYTRSRRSRR